MIFEPTYSSVEVMRILESQGIRACRERINQLADALFGRDPADWRQPRRVTVDQLHVLREAFALIDSGLPRQTVVELFSDPQKVFTQLTAALDEARAGVRQFQEATCLEERAAAVQRVSRAVGASRLVAA